MEVHDGVPIDDRTPASAGGFIVRRAWLVGSVVLCVFVLACRWLQPDVLVPVTLVPAYWWVLPALVLTRFGAVDPRTGRWSRAAWIVLASWGVFLVLEVEEPRSLVRGWLVPADRSHDVRIVTLNTGDGGVRSIRALAALEPDIVLVQEAPGTPALKEATAELFGDEGDFVSVGDVAILARGRVEPIDAKAGSHFVRAEVTIAGLPSLDVVSLRLHPPPPRFDFWSPGFWRDHWTVRTTHRGELQEVVASYGDSGFGPRTIFGGDFNAVPEDAAIKLVRADLTDAFTVAGRGWGPTGANPLPVFRVDQVWVGTHVRVVTARTFSTEWSDHQAVICDLDLPE